MTKTSNIRTTTRIGLLAMAIAFGASSMSPAFARGGGEAGGGAGANPMQIAAQNIAVPQKPKPKKGPKRSINRCAGPGIEGSTCTIVLSAR